MVISLPKSDLMLRLKDALVRAEKEDIRAKKEHERLEQAALQKFREQLRLAMKWDYATAKKHRFEVDLNRELRPTCPTSSVPEIKHIIRCVEADTRKAPFHIPKGSDVEQAMNWLPPHERPKKSVCDE